MHHSDISRYSTEEVVQRIIKLTESLTDFWKSAEGWAPLEAAQLLTKSRLDWQASLARQLKLFLLPEEKKESGALILAWTTLGSLTEGLLKLFLSIYYKDYQGEQVKTDIKTIKDRNDSLIEPDVLVLEKLKVFFAKRIFTPELVAIGLSRGEVDWIQWITKIQHRRNAIHAFQDKDIGTFDEFHGDLKNYLMLMRKINGMVPYPDEIYEPTEL